MHASLVARPTDRLDFHGVERKGTIIVSFDAVCTNSAASGQSIECRERVSKLRFHAIRGAPGVNSFLS